MVGSIAGSFYRTLSLVMGMSAESSLVNFAFRSPVELGDPSIPVQ
jgi:hypothetical protein